MDVLLKFRDLRISITLNLVRLVRLFPQGRPSLYNVRRVEIKSLNARLVLAYGPLGQRRRRSKVTDTGNCAEAEGDSGTGLRW